MQHEGARHVPLPYMVRGVRAPKEVDAMCDVRLDVYKFNSSNRALR